MGKRLDHPLDGGDVRYSLRVPPALYAQFVDLADENGRSLHAEIVQAMRDYARRHARVTLSAQRRP